MESQSNPERYNAYGQTRGDRAVWYERKGRIYIDVPVGDYPKGRRLVRRIFRNSGACAARNELFEISELRRIEPLTDRGLGGCPQGGDPPQPLTAAAVDYGTAEARRNHGREVLRRHSKAFDSN